MLWGQSIVYWDRIGFLMMIVGGVFGFLSVVTSLGSSFVLYRVADAQGLIITANAAATEERLLNERRLTANERWRLERIEKIVLPRSLSPQQHQQIVAALKGTLSSINLYYDQDSEPTMFALAIRQTFMDADIQVKFFNLPPGTVQKGVVTYAPDKQGQVFAEKLWRSGGIGGGSMGVIPMNLTGVLREGENALIVGLNDAIMQPQAGQPGEGIDANGVPVPAP